jgi:AraC-like DNA-binding protein
LPAPAHFRQTTPGIESLPEKFALPRHRHLRSYVTVALAGEFFETGYVGRICATPGDVIIHPALDCHSNRMITDGIKIIRLHWHRSYGAPGLHRIESVDAIAKAAETDIEHATSLLREAIRTRPCRTPNRRNDWPDLLAAELTHNPSLRISKWSTINGLAPETVSRGFALAYGVAPKVFRAELRTRAAWLQITRSSAPLSAIAAETGFSDQAHMTRWVHALTGATPTFWRGAWSNAGNRSK